MLVPPANFGIAEEGIYRCSKVETLNLSFLETLNLKTAIFIGGQEPSKFFKDFFTRSSIKWIVLRMSDFSAAAVPVKSSSASKSVSHSNNNSISSLQDEKKTKYSNVSQNSVATDPVVREELSYHLSDNDDLMLIKSTCLKRTFKTLLNADNYNVLLVDKTALVIGILRKIQKWNIASIINEYRLFSGKNRNYFAETFLEIISINIEQEKDDKTIVKRQSPENNNRIHSIEYKANSGKLIKVNEDDLCKEPEVPQRLLTLINQIETKVKNNKVLQVRGIMRDDLKKASSDLGIFGHRYRLAFNKKENGEYGYYKAGGKDNVKIRIPGDPQLPDWFKFQRDLWEKENVPEEHHFYREHIFT
ncbi:YCR095C-like protein [Saccharomyces cerevisiae x Saccharomyces kudriavzevii VIN7]|uniref:YCR095C-like protein n=1 Tax=Saccharomyces cerevisiae x Saccharomyces kudriavzevii (strain VIN7) TaxID=1095631 RepID=H0GS08_SACCK|nr:YCR095C-like protein [Saccharomyces cerevisiae x Saccharomyces kudriavzevii VIN7]